MRKITVCQGAGIESHLWCWKQLTQTVQIKVGGAVRTRCPGPSSGASPSLTSSSGPTQVLSEWVPTEVPATLKTTQKSPLRLAPHHHRAVFLSAFPSQVCRAVEAFLWGRYSDIRSFALEISYLGGQSETPPTQTWEWYRKDHKGWADGSVALSTGGSFREPKLDSQ